MNDTHMTRTMVGPNLMPGASSVNMRPERAAAPWVRVPAASPELRLPRLRLPFAALAFPSRIRARLIVKSEAESSKQRVSGER